MVITLEVIYALLAKIQAIVPESEHYIGGILQGYSTPAFLYFLKKEQRIQETIRASQVKLDIQMICLLETDSTGVASYMALLQMVENLQVFLNTFQLEACGRVLKFQYDIKIVENVFVTDLQFAFLDGVETEKQEEMLVTEVQLTPIVNE